MMVPADDTLSPSRRAALLQLGALCGLALSGDVLAAVAGSRKAGPPLLLTPTELALTGVLAELIIPRTDTPGALAVGAHRTIDHLLHACSTAAHQGQFRAGLARIDAVAQAHAGKGFAALTPTRQAALLHRLDAGAEPFTAADREFFRQLKGHVTFAYYTSEAGASRELAYLPVPGGFTGRIKVTPATRAWAI
ncbi:gluconate 2-dehydrogenase subunit 3 family protein [Pseudoduganella buxea]|uniref:Gluconate 2-dehydrogenase subunit 3 family protein n=2 Tax=Pseudoduganella buxea TaxID=1949069 RepID=A0A6I3SVB1_9BURK|nr:gluconate 2-dehydrogenase subunit 3 family protein [Pseudoduganella buxea]MTV53151.1 gluconate 2-dehydrogenase subunit 3 family protein [Pseudoduganella buxea]